MKVTSQGQHFPSGHGRRFAAKISEGQQAVTEGADADLSEHEEGERFGRNEK
jgi:hypothetical protein